MKLFTIDKDGKLVQFREKEFREENKEMDLENLLENNPEYFFEDAKILIIGRQVTTNLNTYIDLLGIDQFGNTVVIELKREKTPRETLAQLLEYTSFVDNLDYEQLNEIYQNHIGEELSLEDHHCEYFKSDLKQKKVSWNKNSKLVIVASVITPEIKQTSLYLRKKGLDIYCVEFKYFSNHVNNKMISSDFVVGDDEYLKTPMDSATQLPKTNKDKFVQSLDENGKIFFEKLFQFAEQEGLYFRWGSKGCSLNKSIEKGFVGLCFGYPPDSVFKQSIYSGFEEIRKKINNSEVIITFYREELHKIKGFEDAGNNLKWVINKKIPQMDIDNYFNSLKNIIKRIELEGLKE